MANKIEYTNYPSDSFVSASSRYYGNTIINYGNLRSLTFTTYKRKTYAENPGDLFSIIPPGMEYRPDQMSQYAYGTPDFWWKIMEANQIWDIYDFKAGLNIRIPSNLF
jgi:hypothetical protein